MKTRKLSIIIPVYQVEPYLERCINSVLGQTFLDYEVILVDDGSTDGSEKICDKYAARFEKITVIHKKNGGLSSARNRGIEAASGEYLMFLDSDDILHSRAAELEVQLLEENQADIVICPLARFKDIQEIDCNAFINETKVSIVSGLEAERGFFNNPAANMYVSSCGKVFRSELFNDICFPEGRLFEDEFTTYKLYYLCKRIVVIDCPLYFYFINDSGITRNLDIVKRMDEYDAQEERIAFFKGEGEVDLYHLSLLGFLQSAQWDLLMLYKNQKKNYSKYKKRLQTQYKKALIQAEAEKIISFIRNYDYYVVAYPERKILYRIRRQVLKLKNNL